MTGLDWLIVSATVLLALTGYARGLIVAAFSLTGFVGGAVLGTRVAALLLPGGSSSPYPAAFGLLGGVLAGVILATAFEGFGARLGARLPAGALRLVDGLAGAVLGAAVALAAAWTVGAVLLAFPGAGGARATIVGSAILRRLDELISPTAALGVIERFDPLPSIAGPVASIAPPPARFTVAAGVGAARTGVVRVLGTACGLGIEGSGWVVAPGEVVTNAHVVAGEADTAVERDGRPPALPATVVLFDPRNDIAILRVEGLGLRPLVLAQGPLAGTGVAILGYPDNGTFNAEPGRIGGTGALEMSDAYGQRRVRRAVTTVRGLIRPGNSGGPAIDAAGAVVTTIFAQSTGAGPQGGFGVANAAVRADLRRSSRPASTERCTS